jgi:hypothetical protein
MMKRNCTNCRKRKTCTAICDKIEEFVNQDNIGSWSKIRFTNNIDERIIDTNPKILSTTEIIIQNYYIDRMTVKQISETHYKSRQYIYKIIRKYSNILKENLLKSSKNS